MLSEHENGGLRQRLILTATVLAFAGLAAPLTAADAAPAAPAGCVADPGFTFSNVTNNYIDVVKNYGQSRITLTASLTVGGTIGRSQSYEISAIPSATTTFNASVTSSITVSATVSSAWQVTASQLSGWIAGGAFPQSFNWAHGSYDGACKWVVNADGTGKLPYKIPSWHHS